MTWLASERDVAMMEMSLEYSARSRDAAIKDTALPVPDFGQIAKEALVVKTLVRSYHRSKVHIYLRDSDLIAQKGRNFLVLLLAISDKRRPDHVLSDPELGERREVLKEDNEGTEYSCHVVLDTKPMLNGGASYRTAVEIVPQFSLTYIRRYVQHLFKQVSIEHGHSVPHPAGVKKDGSFVEVPVSVRTEMKAVPSEQLLRDLEKGVLAEIELSKETEGAQGFDEKAYTVDRRSKLILGLTRAQEGVSPLKVIRSVCKTADEKKFSVAKVTWAYDNGDRKASASFDCDTATPIESRYVRRHTFSLDEELPASCERLSGRLARKMIEWIS